jgi:hypothetical protein
VTLVHPHSQTPADPPVAKQLTKTFESCGPLTHTLQPPPLGPSSLLELDL